ncbi:hypothetical protein EJ05DRAFT_336633 [Pseudovirgaria hyperparasitica]|uniref:Uncharacterized protein n=1 Tax=Pseudovirgaria hyperparasitica TaxID=470096 RepID=A0A6A6W9F8_9PEZI|nr:uncharacterized protein EJ05DRAFT_336633 [Pseudovirgaria hyperparasitica]KAF2759195.1 hypothetical protein EJ05DRAFT_336633 [Pseudovirgaria hyperparasitica]
MYITPFSDCPVVVAGSQRDTTATSCSRPGESLSAPSPKYPYQVSMSRAMSCCVGLQRIAYFSNSCPGRYGHGVFQATAQSSLQSTDLSLHTKVSRTIASVVVIATDRLSLLDFPFHRLHYCRFRWDPRFYQYCIQSVTQLRFHVTMYDKPTRSQPAQSV